MDNIDNAVEDEISSTAEVGRIHSRLRNPVAYFVDKDFHLFMQLVADAVSRIEVSPRNKYFLSQITCRTKRFLRMFGREANQIIFSVFRKC